MHTLTLTDSYVSSILRSLAKMDTHDARDTLHELERQGVKIPVWIQRDVLAEKDLFEGFPWWKTIGT